MAAEAAVAKATAASEAATEALAMKEQQLTEWRQLVQASKETASQQVQLSQVGRLHSTMSGWHVHPATRLALSAHQLL